MSSSIDKDVADVAAPVEMLLTRAAKGGVWRRLIPGRTAGHTVVSLANRPELLGRRVTGLASEYARIVTGKSSIGPGAGDRRFTDPGWSGNPLFKKLMQAYLISAESARSLVDELELEPRDAERARFAVDLIADAASPSNIAPVNPLFWKALLDTGGASAVRGLRNLVSDVSSAPRVPTMVDTSSFRVGQNIAAAPGSVVLRTPQFELLQYSPVTPTVGVTPLLIVPPVINKYYLVELSPGRSLVEYLVSMGQQVFVMSWRNPDVRHREWGFDVYGEAVGAAIDATLSISGAPSAHLLSLCSGGALSAMYASHLAALGKQEKVATFSLAVAVLDQSGGGTLNALADKEGAADAVRASQERGYLDGSALAEVFAWLRPNDLIWNYWVNNYLQGRPAPAFDILFWNADTTRMTAGLHRDFIHMFVENKLARPGAARMLGSPVDLSTITVDSYIVAGVSDHICPWESCYRSTAMLGGKTRFVLSRSGHVACLVNPPSNTKATFRVAESTPTDPQDWLELAETRKGSWWVDYAAWLADRNGGTINAPTTEGDDDHPILEAAPGSYVFDN
ncbi:PHA/PHB synthase family protein [Millisia brevis]|uniref:PHA/PHB synthase family protein n=1 Tax=Millisia brevis TaxID=264148 RepID=UPI00082C78A1|nr:alpha/beta fold hydrolase [Millisia brevis]